MTTLRRWLIVALGVLVLVSLPVLVPAARAWRDRGAGLGTSPADIRQAALGSESTPYSGYAEANGGLALPVSGEFNALADLLGGQSQLRVWWNGPGDWRVDQLSFAGESDSYENWPMTWTWNYESNLAVLSTAESGALQARLPEAADLVPASLARRLLSQATPSELLRIGDRTIAGRAANGIRLRPSEPGGTIDHVDLWIDASTGVPLRVAAYQAGNSQAVLSSTFLDFAPVRTSTATTRFSVPSGARVQVEDQPDLADLVRRFPDQVPPAQLAGMARNTVFAGVGPVAVYGRGVTELVVTELSLRTAYSLGDQLQKAPGAVQSAAGISVTVGPLSVLLTPQNGDRRSWLLTGTVTPAMLASAAAGLPPAAGLGG